MMFRGWFSAVGLAVLLVAFLVEDSAKASVGMADSQDQRPLVIGLGVGLVGALGMAVFGIKRARGQCASAQADLAQARESVLKAETALREEAAKNQALAEALAESVRDKEAKNESALVFLTLLQERGRLIDFLMEDVSGYTDQEVGVASRVVHGGCRKLLQECFSINPILQQPEGAKISVNGLDDKFEATSRDSTRYYRLIGKVPEVTPSDLEGKLIHRGWLTTKINLPKRVVNTPIRPVTDLGVIVPAEIEI